MNTFAAGFDCAKAKTPVEKMICANESLSKLDELLNKTYKKELSNASTIPEIQLSWLTNVRNNCKDVECLKKVYGDRIEKLNKQEDLVSDNCRNETCWWDYIKEQKIIKKANQNKLVKVTVIRKVGTYPSRGDFDVKESDIVIEKSIHEYFAFCSKKLPVMIDCDKKDCSVRTPRIDAEGQPEDSAGYDEASDVYINVCKEIEKFEIPKGLNKADSFVSLCIDDIRKINATQFEFTRKNFTPEKDLSILFLERN